MGKEKGSGGEERKKDEEITRNVSATEANFFSNTFY